MLPPMNRRAASLWIILISIVTLVLELSQAECAAIWPSLAALLLVFTTRNVLLGLLGGAVVGSVLLSGWKLWLVPFDLVENHLLPSFGSPWKSGAIVFTLLLGGFVHLLEKGGVLQQLLFRMLHGKSRRKVESGAAVFGLMCFFDGLANSLMVGRIFQPVAEQSGVSKVRLAYIVDTTSAAVACLAFVSTWIAYQLSMIREGFILAGQESLAEPYSLFFQSLPHNYYAWFALMLMGLAIWKQWNFGPMKAYANTMVDTDPPDRIDAPVNHAPARDLWRAWIPVAVLLSIIFTGIYFDGTTRMGTGAFPFSMEKLAMAFSEANVPVILIAGSGLGAFLAWIFFPKQVGKDQAPPGTVFVAGMVQLFQPVLILVMAWILSSTLNSLGAADYLGGVLGGRMPPELLPLSVFLLGSLVAFTTGTSWGTMGLLMPLAIPIAFSLHGNETGPAMELIPLIIGAVFSGAVFGDHCSPISDTTIVSSFACGVEPIDHVRTQLPYAFVAAAGAAVVGFPVAGFSGGSPAFTVLSCVLYLCFLLVVRRIFPSNASNA